MQFVCFALVCVIAVQAVFVSARPAAGEQQVAVKPIEQLHEEFIKEGTRLQTDLKNAHPNSNLKDDTYAQALVNAIEELDQNIVQKETNLMDPKHPLSQAVFVSARPAAGEQQVAVKTIEQLHEEFIKVGIRLQAVLKNAHTDSNLKDDTHAQALVNAIEELDQDVVQKETNLMDPKHPLSQDEIKQLNSDMKTLLTKIESEYKQLEPASKQPIKHILHILGERAHLLKEISEKTRA